MLQLDFFESGLGETIIITFPNGKVGIVDAHPSTIGSRPGICELLKGKEIIFACLTHPHADHGLDLIPIFQKLPVGEFWHTIDSVSQFIFQIQNTPEFQSPFKEAAATLKAGWARFAIDLFYNVAEKEIPNKILRNDLREVSIEDVRIIIGWPNPAILDKFTAAYVRRAQDSKKDLSDKNELSAVLILKYGNHSIILGADALKSAWVDVKKVFHQSSIPKSSVLKVPHHGATNALNLDSKRDAVSYLELCINDGTCSAVLFAGDVKHPAPSVREKLESKTQLLSFTDLDSLAIESDPLFLNQYGGTVVQDAGRKVKASQITVKIEKNGSISQETQPFPSN